MNKTILTAVCLLPFLVAGLTIDLIVGASLGFFKLLSIDATVWMSIFLSNMIYVGFTKTREEIETNLKK